MAILISPLSLLISSLPLLLGTTIPLLSSVTHRLAIILLPLPSSTAVFHLRCYLASCSAPHRSTSPPLPVPALSSLGFLHPYLSPKFHRLSSLASISYLPASPPLVFGLELASLYACSFPDRPTSSAKAPSSTDTPPSLFPHHRLPTGARYRVSPLGSSLPFHLSFPLLCSLLRDLLLTTAWHCLLARLPLACTPPLHLPHQESSPSALLPNSAPPPASRSPSFRFVPLTSTITFSSNPSVLLTAPVLSSSAVSARSGHHNSSRAAAPPPSLRSRPSLIGAPSPAAFTMPTLVRPLSMTTFSQPSAPLQQSPPPALSHPRHLAPQPLPHPLRL